MLTTAEIQTEVVQHALRSWTEEYAVSNDYATFYQGVMEIMSAFARKIDGLKLVVVNVPIGAQVTPEQCMHDQYPLRKHSWVRSYKIGYAAVYCVMSMKCDGKYQLIQALAALDADREINTLPSDEYWGIYHP